MNVDIFLYISQFLSLRDKMNLAQVSKEMYQISLYIGQLTQLKRLNLDYNQLTNHI